MKRIVILIIILSVVVCCKQRHLNLVDSEPQSFTFITLNDTVQFSPSYKNKLSQIFKKADSLVFLSKDSSFFQHVDSIDNYDFVYHHSYVETLKISFDYIIVSDSINKKEVYINKIDNFVDNLSKYSNLYYEQNVR